MTKTIEERARVFLYKYKRGIYNTASPHYDACLDVVQAAMREVAEECAGIAEEQGELVALWAIRDRFNLGGDDG